MTGNKRYKPLKNGKKETIFSGLHSLLASGLDFSRAFQLLINGENDKRVKQYLEHIYATLVNGHALWKSFLLSGVFSPLDYGVLRVGEETGRIAEATLFLSDYYRKREEQKRVITGAISYPLIILITAFVVLLFMILVIVPMFEQVYARMGGEPPALTRGIISLSNNFPIWLAISACLFLGGGIFYFFYGQTDQVQSFLSRLVLHCPGIGRLTRENFEARFCKLLYLLYGSGIPLLKGIEMLEDIITFYPYRQSFGIIRQQLKHGALFAETLGHFPALYDKRLITLVQVGEETNRLREMLNKQGEDLTRELEHRLKQLGNLLEPILILCVGGLVALVLVSMYLPMFKLGGIIG